MKLAPYAVPYNKTLGREYPDVIDPMRTHFQRDRDRIIHSKAFRRLAGKTQVFLAHHADHTRDRLTHSMEVAQVGRDMARSLNLNEDLCEGIALAHDLGHTPFAHSGQDTMNEIMQEYGSHFEHNEQSKRIVEVLEKYFPHCDGLNLTWEVREGLAKHQTLYDQRTKQIKGKTLEAQVVDIADEIAYHNHDIEDALREELFELDELLELPLMKQAYEEALAHFGSLDEFVLKERLAGRSMMLMIQDCLANTALQISKAKLKTMEDVISQATDVVGFSANFQPKVQQLRDFLWERMYNAPQLVPILEKGQGIIRQVFAHMYKHPELLPPRFVVRREAGDPLYVVVKDYVAGMTDSYITEIARML
ncbi:dNTP triphosphohydrolase [Candidatus Gracilibacteria bacterium]|nr:dNTP triphosphohydrolase [Candidatus Gracilibacteria bacterium]